MYVLLLMVEVSSFRLSQLARQFRGAGSFSTGLGDQPPIDFVRTNSVPSARNTLDRARDPSKV